ncbi:RICIN domain-containing protein [Actinocorallia aurea]
MRVSRGSAALVSVVAALSLLVGTAAEAAAEGARPKLSAAGEKKRPKAPDVDPVPGKNAKPGKMKLQGKPDQERSKADWPGAREQDADLTPLGDAAKKDWIRAGDLPVWLNRPGPRRDKGKKSSQVPEQIPAKVSARVLDQEAAHKAGVKGVVVELSAQVPGRVKVGVNYAEFATAYGGDWASRLRLLRLPDCAATTPDEAECQVGTPIPSVNDPGTSTVSADVEIASTDAVETSAAAPSDGTSATPAETAPQATALFAVAAAQSGPGGDWTATKLSASSSWSAGSNTGGFAWNYEVQVPPVPGELVPSIVLAYSSASSDGKTSAENQQASWIGEGFDYSPGFIERRYRTCTDDNDGADIPATAPIAGEMCWWNDNAHLSMGGRSGELIYYPGQDIWRLADDDGTVLRRYTGDPDGVDEANDDNGDNNKEWWVMATPDGTRYFFGRDKPDDWTSGAGTNSVWTVPVVGDDAGEPCHDADTYLDSFCDKQAWRWNLDHVIDSNNNTLTYFYDKEWNNYAKNSGRDNENEIDDDLNNTPYISGGYLKEIWYGQRRKNGDEGGTFGQEPTAKVIFSRTGRTDYPTDQRCTDGEACGDQRRSPSFFEREKLSQITTKLRDFNGITYDTVNHWDLEHDYRNGVLWLAQLQQFGSYNAYGAGASARPYTFDNISLPNRVTNNPQGGAGLGADDRPAAFRPRMLSIHNGSGGSTTVNWAATNCVWKPADKAPFPWTSNGQGGGTTGTTRIWPATNTQRCYPVKYIPADTQPDAMDTWAERKEIVQDDWFHKYVVDKVVETSYGVAGSEAKTTDYSYVGGGAWKFEARDGLADYLRTYNQWRGYATVRTITGDEANENRIYTEAKYARGMSGNPDTDPIRVGNANYPVRYVNDDYGMFEGDGVRDVDRLAGQVIQTRTFKASGWADADAVSGTISKPAFYPIGAERTLRWGGKVQPGYVRTEWSQDWRLDHAGVRTWTKQAFVYDKAGRTVVAEDQGSTNTDDDNICTRTSYPNQNFTNGEVEFALGEFDWENPSAVFLDRLLDVSPGKNLLTYYSVPSRVLSVNAPCRVFGTVDRTLTLDGQLAGKKVVSDVKTIYDGRGYRDYPSRGNATTIEAFTQVVGGYSQTAPTTVTTYDAYGRSKTVTDKGDGSADDPDRTTTMTFEHSDGGWLWYSTVDNALGHPITTTYNPAFGVPVKVEDANARIATAHYDGLGRMTEAWLPDNKESAGGIPSTKYTYDTWANPGDPVEVITQTLVNKATGKYRTSVDIYDGLLRPRQTQTEAVGGGRIITDTFYDSRGLAWKSNAGYPISSGFPAQVGQTQLWESADNAVPAQTITKYDHTGRPFRTISYSYGSRLWETNTIFQGDRTTTVPPDGAKPVMQITDVAGNLVEQRQYKINAPVGADGHPQAFTTAAANNAANFVASTFEYDSLGRPSKVKDAADNTWETGYNALGQVAWTKDPDKGQTTLAYNSFDEVISTTDARGKTITTKYDKLGRATGTWQGSTKLTETLYDTLAKGLPTSSTRYVGGTDAAHSYVTKVRGYDVMYRPTGSILTIPASEGFGTSTTGTTSFTTAQTYNEDGTPRTLSYPAVAGTTGLPLENVTTYYNGDGLPTWNTGLSTYVADTTYTALGEISQLSMAAVSDRFIWQTFNRDESTRRLTSAEVKRQTSNDFADSKTSYFYTDSGSITSVLNEQNGLSERECYTYDYAQRLEEAWTTKAGACQAKGSASTIAGIAPYWNVYGYDEDTGNRKTETIKTFTGSNLATDIVRTYNYGAPLGTNGPASPHALQSISETFAGTTITQGYTYDQTGNTISRPGGQELAWNDEGDLSSVGGDGATAGAFRVISRGSKKCLELPNSSQDQAAKLQQANCDETAKQDWRIVPVAGTTDTFTLVSPVSGQCMDVAAESLAAGAAVQQWACNGKTNQQWVLERSGDHYKLKAKHSGLCLDVPGGAHTNGLKLQQDVCNTQRYQQWKLQSAANYIYDASGSRLIAKDSTGATLYLPGQEVKITYTSADRTTSKKSAIRYYSHAGMTVAYRTATASTSLQFLTADPQGTSELTVNAVDQDQYTQRWYEPFGAERASATPTLWPLAFDKGFVGGTKDSTGLTHLGAREYDPDTARFLSVDPVFVASDPASWTNYGYAGYNPIDYSDPTGTTRCSLDSTLPGCKDYRPPEAPPLPNPAPSDPGITGPAPTAPAPAPAPAPVEKKCGTWDLICKSKKFVVEHKTAIVSTALGVGCGLAVGWTGVGAVGCGALVGAVNYAMSTPRDQWNATGFLVNAAVGGLGAMGGGLLGKAANGLKTVGKSAISKLASKGGPVSKKIADKASGGAKKAATKPGCNSFVPGTRVVMADGSAKAIEDVDLGDKVLATDETTGTTTPRPVTATIAGAGAKSLTTLTIDTDGAKGTKTATLTATDNHPFWVPTLHEWVKAADLKPGTWLRTSAGTSVQLTSLRPHTTYTPAHNLTVATNHTYYVLAGNTPVLVHNCGPGDAFDGVADDLAGSKVTTGQVVDDAGNKIGGPVSSGEHGSFPAVRDAIQESGLPHDPTGSFAAASHVETKIALAMRNNGVTRATAVINNPAGVCPGPYSCSTAVPSILPSGSSLTIWWRNSDGWNGLTLLGRG